MKKFLTALAITAAVLTTPALADEVKIGDTFTVFDSTGYASLRDLATGNICYAQNGVNITVLETEGEQALVSLDNYNSDLKPCPTDSILKAWASVITSFEKDKEEAEIEAVQIEKMLKRLEERAKAAE